MMQEHKPWRSLLRAPSAFDADALWSRVAARRGRRRALRRGALPMLGFALASLLVFAGRGWFAREPSLTRLDGKTLARMEAGATPAEVLLSDGSRIELDPGARLETRTLTPTSFETELAAGTVMFDVVPHGPRTWRITAGATEVRVLGTRFSVARSGAELTVRVERGVVEVSGPAVPGGSRRLRAGEALLAQEPVQTGLPPSAADDDRSRRTDAAEPLASAPTVAAPAQASPPPSAAGDASAASVASRRAERSHRSGASLAHAGTAPPSAATAATRVAADASSDGIERSLRDADQARASGEAGRAAKLLARVVAEHPRDPRAALAAFTLAELYLGPLALPLRAALTFERAQALGLPAALAEVGAARRFEAYAAAGDVDAATRAAHAYLSEFPSGAHRRAAERLTSAP